MNTGTVEQTFKGGVSAPGTLCLLKNDYLLSAELGKPLLHHWIISRKVSLLNITVVSIDIFGLKLVLSFDYLLQDCKQTRIVLPGKVEALAISHDGYYLAAAIAEKIHIWQVCLH